MATVDRDSGKLGDSGRNMAISTHTYTHTHPERERERERDTHTMRERERERVDVIVWAVFRRNIDIEWHEYDRNNP